MELLLNLTWLLLALPAYWLWRRRWTSRKASSLQCLLALGSVLVILFPVISATDDLHAMRAEMEETPISKRTLRQASSDKTPLWNLRLHNPAAVASWNSAFFTGDEAWQQLLNPSLSMPVAPAMVPAGRAPPFSFLA